MDNHETEAKSGCTTHTPSAKKNTHTRRQYLRIVSVAALLALLLQLDHRKGMDSVVAAISNVQNTVLAAADASWLEELSDSCTLGRTSAKHGHKQAVGVLERLDSVVA